MKRWWWRSPVSFAASLVWNFCEYWRISFPWPAQLFGLMNGYKARKVDPEKKSEPQ